MVESLFKLVKEYKCPVRYGYSTIVEKCRRGRLTAIDSDAQASRKHDLTL